MADALDPKQVGVPQATSTSAHGLTGFVKKAFRRLMIWFVSLCVAFYVPIEVAGIPYDLASWEQKIAQTGRFTDVFLCTMAMVVLSGSGLIDNIIARRRMGGDAVTTGCAITIMVIYFLFVFFGMPAYGIIQRTAVTLNLPWDVLLGLLAVGLFGEVMIATIPD